MSLPIRPAPEGPLPPKQQAVLDFITAELAQGRKFPAMGAIAAHMGWSTEGSAYDCLCRLEWRGKVKREKAERRAHDLHRRYTWKVLNTW